VLYSSFVSSINDTVTLKNSMFYSNTQKFPRSILGQVCGPTARPESLFIPIMSLPTFPTSTLRIVCIADTHNDNPTPHIPEGDIFIHAGDIVDRGSTIHQYEAALDWISNLPHRLKIVVGGNNDVDLDAGSHRYKPDILELFKSEEVKAKGVIYLDREIRVVGYIKQAGVTREIKIYGNPLQPEFSGNKYPFTYHPFPDSDAESSWKTAPDAKDGVQIWVTHGGPLDRLDKVKGSDMTGCPVQARKVAESKPLLCVYGHFHYSWGVEVVKWREQEMEELELLTMSEEQRINLGLSGPRDFDFSGSGDYEKAEPGKKTIFVNAAWMTNEKRQVKDRNLPITVTLSL
jgi:hypothetical protein